MPRRVPAMSLLLAYRPAEPGGIGLTAQRLLAVVASLEGQGAVALEHGFVLSRGWVSCRVDQGWIRCAVHRLSLIHI